jgi:hypothetical protein
MSEFERKKKKKPDTTLWSGFDDPFDGEELNTVVSNAKSNKAPGPDGLGAAFYKTVWKEIGSLMLDIINDF